VGAAAAVWLAGCGLFGSSLDSQQQDVVDTVEAGTHTSDADAAARFVSGDLDVLLSDDVAGAVDADALAELFEVALADDAQTELFARVVAAVAAEGEIHSEALRPVLMDAATARLASIDEWVNAYFAVSAPTGQVRDDYFAARDFLRAALRDPRAAERFDRAVDDYGQAETARAPESGDPRLVRLSQLGRLGAFVTAAWYEAERGEGDDPDAALAADARRRSEDRTSFSVWVALDRYESDAAVRASAQGQPFVDETGAIKRDLSPDEAEALRHWAESLTVDGGLAATDLVSILAGVADIPS
jgi:hypothetical protein